MPWISALENHPEHVRAIGMISIENANLELSLADLLAATLFLSKKVAHAIYFTPRAAALRVEILEAAAKANLEPHSKSHPAAAINIQKRKALSKIERLTKRARAQIQKRHEVIHDAWGVAHEEESRPVIRQNPGQAMLGKDAQPVPLNDLLALVKALRDLIDDVDALTLTFRQHPPSMVSFKKASTNDGDSANAVSEGSP